MYWVRLVSLRLHDGRPRCTLRGPRRPQPSVYASGRCTRSWDRRSLDGGPVRRRSLPLPQSSELYGGLPHGSVPDAIDPGAAPPGPSGVCERRMRVQSRPCISPKLVEDTARELMARAAIDIPLDFRDGVRAARDAENGKLARFVLTEMLDNWEVATAERRPMCA